MRFMEPGVWADRMGWTDEEKQAGEQRGLGLS